MDFKGNKMADINQDELDKMHEALRMVSERFSITSDDLKKLTKGTKEYTTAQKAMTSNLSKDFDALGKKVKDGTSTIDDHKDALTKVNKALDVMEDSAEKTELSKKKRELESVVRNDALADSTAKLTTAFVTGAVKGVGEFVKGLQNGGSSTQLATSAMMLGVDAAESGLKSAGQAAQGLGSMLMVLGPIGVAAGAALTVLGVVAESTAAVAAKLAKFGIEYLSKEVEKIIVSFNTLSATGALYANGMTGMVDAATSAGLTIEQFSNVVKNNSDKFAAAGLSVAGGVQMINGILTKDGSTLKRNLLNLGYGFEEQVELLATVMKDMRGSTTGPLQANKQQIEESTAKYAENLRIISAVTGEDAKKKMDAVRQQASQLAFQQKLARKSPEEQAAIMRAMGNMNEIQKKNFMDMVNFGSVINRDGAVAASLSPALRDSVNEAYRAMNQGKLDDIKQRQLNTKYNGQMQKEFLAQEAIGTAGAANTGGIAQSVAEILGQTLQEIKAQTPEAIAAAEKAAKEQSNTINKMTTSLVDASDSLQNMKVTIQDKLIGEDGALSKFASVTKSIVGSLEDVLDSLELLGKKAQVERKKRLTNESIEKLGNVSFLMPGGAKASKGYIDQQKWLNDNDYKVSMGAFSTTPTYSKNGKTGLSLEQTGIPKNLRNAKFLDSNSLMSSLDGAFPQQQDINKKAQEAWDNKSTMDKLVNLFEQMVGISSEQLSTLQKTERKMPTPE